MVDIFIENNFSVLQKKLEETEFHIHGKTIEEIYNVDINDHKLYFYGKKKS